MAIVGGCPPRDGTLRRFRNLLICAAAALVVGCATYAPVPLPPAAEILSAPYSRDAIIPVAHPRLPARPVDPARPLDDFDLARLALVTSPDLAASRARAGVADAQLVAAGLLPDPQLSLSIDRPSAPGLVDALAGGLVFDFGALVTRRSRVEGARHARDQARLDVAWTEWLALNHVRMLARRLPWIERQIAVAREAESAADEIYRLMHANMRRGDARLDDVTVYQVGLLDARDRRLALERQAEATRQELNLVLGAPPSARLMLAPARPLHSPATLDPEHLALRAGDERLDLGALRAGYEAQERSLRTAALRALPLPQLGLSRARDSGGIWSHGLSAGTTLPLWNRNRGEIAIATATRAQLAAEYRARLLQARGDLGTQVAALQTLDAERRALAMELPTLEASARVIGQATREGSVALATYETIRAALLGKRLTLLALEQAQAETEVALETAVGGFVWDVQ